MKASIVFRWQIQLGRFRNCGELELTVIQGFGFEVRLERSRNAFVNHEFVFERYSYSLEG